MLDELDLENEATAQRRSHRSLRNHPLLAVPAPIMRLAHEGVLVSEWIDGIPLADAPDPDEAAARLVLFVRGAARAGRVLEQLGWLPSRYAATALHVAQHALGDLAGPEPVRLDSDAVLGARDRLLQQPDALVQLILAGALPPEDLWPARSVMQLFSTIARVGAPAG